jgi:hypothetical protein
MRPSPTLRCSTLIMTVSCPTYRSACRSTHTCVVATQQQSLRFQMRSQCEADCGAGRAVVRSALGIKVGASRRNLFVRLCDLSRAGAGQRAASVLAQCCCCAKQMQAYVLQELRQRGYHTLFAVRVQVSPRMRLGVRDCSVPRAKRL